MKQLFLVVHTHRFGTSFAIHDSMEAAQNDRDALIKASCAEFEIDFKGAHDENTLQDLRECDEYFEIETVNLNEKLSI